MSAAAATVSPPGPEDARPRSSDAGALALGVALGVALAAIAFVAQGGLLLGRATAVEIAITLAGAAVTAVAIVRAPERARSWGGATIGLLAGFTALTVLSVIWSVNPEETWRDANRAVAYLFAFSGAVSLARLAPGRWPAVLFAVAVAGVIVCSWALVSKVFPSLAEETIYARLREPFGYWNAIGLIGALAIPPLLWLGARRDGPELLRAAAWPATGLVLLVVLLAYSRGAAAAAIAGCGLWFAIVPLRLRALAVLTPAGLVAAALSAYAFSRDGLSTDRVALAERADAGHLFGLFIVIALGALYAAGVWICRTGRRRPPSARTRRRAGIAALCVVGAAPVVALAVLASSSGGIGGTWKDLTDPDATLPANTPGRLTSLGSVRARYWRDAGRVFAGQRLVGVGAEGYATARKRIRDDTVNVRHAHGFVPQTLADLGIVGLAVALALLAAWLAAAARATGLRRRDRGLPFTDERIGLLTLAAVVVVFGVHSLVDWTWVIPGTAVPALLCAGFLAGRGPLNESAGPAPSAITVQRWVGAATVAVIALAGCWAIWQPQRAVDANNDALAALAAGSTATAAKDAATARARDPLSVQPLFTSAAVADAAGRPKQAVAFYEQAVKLQPANPLTWRQLGEYQLAGRRDARNAYPALRAALYLDPRGPTTISLFLIAARALQSGGR